MTNVNDFYTEQESRFARAFCDHATLCSVECACERVHYVTAAGHGVNIHGRADDPVCKLCMLERGQELADYNAAATQYLRNVR